MFTKFNKKLIDIAPEDFLEKVKEIFLTTDSSSQEDREKLLKTLKGNYIKDLKISSKDGRYELARLSPRRTGILTLKYRSQVLLTDKQEDICYRYSAYSLGKFFKQAKAFLEADETL